MFEIGWGELLLIGVVALIAIGPKELPSVLRTAGQWMTKIRRMASEFQGQFQEAMREAEIADLKKQVEHLNESTRSLNTAFDLNTPASSSPVGDAGASTAGTANASPDRASAVDQYPHPLPDGGEPGDPSARERALAGMMDADASRNGLPAAGTDSVASEPSALPPADRGPLQLGLPHEPAADQSVRPGTDQAAAPALGGRA